MSNTPAAERVRAARGAAAPAHLGSIRVIRRDFPRHKYLYLMTAVGVVMVVLFHYLPMYGMLAAFKRFNVVDGIWRSPWIGLDNFKAFLTGPYTVRLIRNTALLGLQSIIWGFWPPIVLALLLNEVRLPTYKRVVQTISYLPHFIAIVVIVGMLKEFFSHNGIINEVLEGFGLEGINFFMEPGWFRPLYVGSGVWQSVGFSSIIYLAVLSGINPELYENATCEGANRWQLTWHITMPSILPTMMILLIFSTTGIVNVGFEKVFLMYNPGIYETADVIQTYVYRVGLAGGQMGYGTAVGLLNSVVTLLFMVAVNYLSRKTTEYSLW